MSEEDIIWEDQESYRHTRAEIGDYELIVSGHGRFQFHWAVFFKGVEIASSERFNPCRSVIEAKRTTVAVYRTAKNIL